MSKNTAINWADHSWTPWEGCTRRSQGCFNCYAEARDCRDLSGTGPHWGPGVPRKEMADGYWCQPLSWEHAAASMGTLPIVLAGELCDWCDDDPGVPEGARERMWDLIRQTPHLRWALLTKRTEDMARFLPADWGEGWNNVVLGATVEDRAVLKRIDDIREIPAKARFLSVEPLLGDLGELDLTGINWVIVGGESGHDARTFRPEWAESILRQCDDQGTAFWMKQLGANPVYLGRELQLTDLDKNGEECHSQNGENWERWPAELEHLKVRQLPDLHSEHLHDAPKRHKEAQIAAVEAELEKLAAGLEPDLAAKELDLRREFISGERSLFLGRLERGRILLAYKAIYGPKRLWSRFLRVSGVARRTSYDLVSAAEEAELARTVRDAECAKSAQSTHQGSEKPLKYVFDLVVDKGVAYLNRSLAKLTDAQRDQALDVIVERVRGGSELKRAA